MLTEKKSYTVYDLDSQEGNYNTDRIRGLDAYPIWLACVYSQLHNETFYQWDSRMQACGDISCARKNLVDVCKLEDESAYSDYELHDKSFRERLTRFNYRDAALGKKLRGLPARYCFKDLHQEQKNPMRSRSMHAEEKALALCGDRAEGGNLFTISSPCEMCSKNAKTIRLKISIILKYIHLWNCQEKCSL